MKENFHKNLINASPFGFAYHKIVLNEAKEPVDYEFIEVNKAFENLTGLDANDITGRKVSDVLPGIRSGSFDWISFYGKVAMEQGEEVFEQYSEPLQRWYKVQVYSPEKNFFATVFTDITAEKDQAARLEKAEKRYRGLIESQSDLIVRVDKENRFTFVNNAYCKTFGKTEDDLLGSDFFPLVHEDDRESTNKAMEQLLFPPYRCYLEQRAMTVNGWRWLAWEDNAILNEKGEIVEVQGVGRDITDKKLKTEELNQYKKRLSIAQTFAKTGSWEYDIKTGKLFWSKECETLFGLEEGAFEGTFEDFLKRVHPDDRDYVVEVNSPITQLKEGIPLSYEHRIIKSSGEILWVNETAGVVNDQSGKPAKIIGLVADITQQKMVAEAIENEEKLRQIVDNINGVFWLRSADRFDMLYVSPSIKTLFGISQQELYDNPNAFTDAVHPGDKERVKKALADFLKTGTFSEEYRIVKPNGEVSWMASNAFPVKNETGETIRFAGIVSDITNQKQSEIAVKDHVQKLNALIEAMPDIYFMMDRQGIYHDVITADPSVLLAPSEKVIGRNISDFFEAEEAERQLNFYKICLNEKRLVTFEYELMIENKPMYFEARLNPVNDEMLLAVVRDVTERKQLLEANRNELEFREFLFKNDRNGLVILDNDHQVIDVNPRFCELTGYTAEELLTMRTWDFDDIMTEKEVREGFDVKQQVDVTFESRHRRKDGSTYEVDVSAISFWWKGERFVYCSCRDITEKKTAAKQLTESEEKYRMLFNANNDSISIFYLNDDGSPSNFVEINDSGAQIVGYTKEELLKMNVAQLEEEAPEDVRRMRVEKIMRDGHAAFETSMRHKSGEKLILETKAILINYKDKPAILNIARDITERKKSEESLKESEFKYRHLINSLHAGIVVHHPDSSIKFSNPQAAVILGLTQDQMEGKTAFDPEWKFVDEFGAAIKPDEYPVSLVIATKKPVEGKVYGVDRSSTHDRIWVQVNAYPEFAQNGELIQAVITFIDISDIKVAEEALSESLEFNRRLLATIPDLVIRTDLDGNIVFLNETAASGSLFHEKEELMGRNMLSFIHETDLERAIENTKRMFEKPLGVQEYKLQLEDGQVLDYEVNGDVVRDAGNNPLGMVYIVRNITERKQAEAALRQSNDIVENIQVGLYIYHLEDTDDDRTLRLKYANPASTAMTGLKAESITGKTLDEIFPNLRKMNVPQRYAEVVRSAKMRTFEDIHYTDNRIMQACYSVKAFPLPNNHVGIAFEDITEKVNIMEAIAQSNICLKEAQAVGNIGSWEYEIQNDKLVWSDQTYRIYGEDPDCFKPTFDEVINHYPEPDRELVLSAYDKAIKSKSDFSLDNRILTKSGDIRFVQQNAKVVLNDNGNPLRLIGSVIDITQRKLAQDAIIHGKQRLEAFLEISRRITTTFDEEKIMQMIVDNAISIMGLGSGAVYLQKDEKTIKLAATSPSLPDDFPDVFRIANLNDHPHIARTFITSSFVFLEDSLTAKLTPAEQEIVKLRGLRTNLYLPISLRGKTIGVLILSSVGETYHFTDEEIFMLQGFANQAAHIIDNVNNFADLKKYASELEQQIAQREEAEEVIRQNEERFRQVAETNQTVIWEISTEGIYTYVSPMAEKIWGYKPTELVDKLSYFNLHPEEGRQEFIEQTMKFLTETGSFNNLVNPIQKRDGSIIWVTSNGLPIYDEHGNLTGYRGSDQDITERLLAEKELLKFKTISDQANYGSAITDFEGKILYINQTYAQMHGWEIEELLGKSLANLHNETQLPAVAELLDELKSTGSFSAKEVDHETKDGRTFTTLTNASVIYNDNKEPLFLAATAIDVTENKAARLELLKLTQAVVQNPVSIIITDTDGIVEYVNPRLCEVSGFQPEEVIGKHTRLFNSGHHPRELYNHMWATITNGEIWNGELMNIKKNGEHYWEKVSISPIKDSEGNIINFVAIKEDITLQKQLLDDLKIAKENAEESNRLKTAFMNNISHEVRTPLNGILGFGEFMLDATLSQSDKLDHFQVLCESSDRLQQTIDDIMDISLIKTGAIKPKINEMLITLVMNQLLEKTMVACSKKNILVTLDVAEENENLTLHTDEELFKKTLTQLLNNAVKFTKLGRITFGFEIIKGYLQFYVKDTGKGIASDKLELIFEPFMQEEVLNTRGYEGSGLGLSIARGFIEVLGGKIWVESEKNVGSVFYFTLPLNKGESITETEEPKIRRSKSAKPLILIAEDEHSNYLYFKAILQRNGFTTLHVFNGAEAVDICHQFPEITLIFMDIKMPVMNGIEATKKIREFRPDLPIIATTAYAQTGDKHRFIAEGCNDYLAKPMKPNDILSMVKKYS